MLLSVITIHPSPEHQDKVIDVLDSMRRMNAANAECQDCLLSVEVGEGNAVYYMECWKTHESLYRHLRSSLYCRVLEAMELSRISPKVEFFEVMRMGGLSLVENARFFQFDRKKED